MEKESKKDLKKFVRYLEKKIGGVNFSDPLSMESVKEIMETRLAVYGDLYLE